ncbi:MAG: hypothetical protein K6A74_02495 [Lachnospiraceae bacterium]|nr:hypothetical protein [Lachnospiraceae bacterium]
MSKKTKNIIAIVAAMLIVVSFIFIILPGHGYSAKIHNVIEVSDNGAEPSVFRTYLTLKEEGKYQISAKWWQEETPGFITALSVSDENGNEVFEVTGGSLTADSTIMELEKGKYEFKFTALGSLEAYNEYAEANFDDPDRGTVPADFFVSGVYEMDYEVSIEEAGGNYYIIGLGCGIVFGILIIALIITAAGKDDDGVKRKYDERQIAAQGTAFKYAFYTMLIYFMVLMIVFGTGVSLPVDNAMLVFIGLITGAVVFGTNSILNDAYFALNENRRFIIISFSFIAGSNLIIGVVRLICGMFLEDGKLTFRSSGNLFCAVFMLLLLTVMVIKGIRDKREED